MFIYSDSYVFAIRYNNIIDVAQGDTSLNEAEGKLVNTVTLETKFVDEFDILS